MKAITKYLMMMVLLLAMSSSSCRDDDEDIVKVSIVGKWEQVNSAGTVITVTFNSNRTGVVHYLYTNNTGDENENFEYDYIDSDRSLTVIGSQLNGVYYVTLTATKLVLSNSKHTYSFDKK